MREIEDKIKVLNITLYLVPDRSDADICEAIAKVLNINIGPSLDRKEKLVAESGYISDVEAYLSGLTNR